MSTSWRTACPDWEDRIKSGRTLVPALPLDFAEGDRAVAIFNRLRLPDVPGQPDLASSAGEWQRDIVRALFGAWDGTQRHIREAFVMIPKKSGKTTMAAAVMVTALLVNRRPRAEFLIVAPSLETSDQAFRQVVGMIEADPVLAAKFYIQEHIKRVTFRPSGAFLKVKSFDPKIVTGTKPAGVLIDEIHVIAEVPNADRVLGQLRGGLLSQPEGFLLQITTQSERPPSGVFLSELTKARKVRDGRLQAPILPVLYEFPAGVDWQDPANWPLVLPNAGRSFDLETLVEQFAAHKEAGEAEFRRWASQHLNVEIGVGLRSDGWAGAQFWSRGKGGPKTLEDLIERSEVVVAGVDGGGLDDLFGFGVIGREKVTKRWLVWAHALISPEGLERRKANRGLYDTFAAEGSLTVVEGLPDDLAWIQDHVALLLDSGKFAGIGADPAGIGGLVDTLAEIGVTEESGLLTGVGQGIRLMGAAKTIERKLVDGSLIHDGGALLAWCAGNAKVRQTSTAMLIERAASGYGKIDPLMAVFDAAFLMAGNPEAIARFDVAAMLV